MLYLYLFKRGERREKRMAMNGERRVAPIFERSKDCLRGP